MPRSIPRLPMKLHLVFGLGFLTSLAVVGGLIWSFAAYETRDLMPFFHSPQLSQDKWFEVIRNAVTTGAALGVGITLFFSYRRQQTAEETQRVSSEAQLTAAKAQETAAKALDLSTKQHALDQDRRKDAVTSELRTRYANTAEQLASSHLAVRLAGIYSLASLADDWAELGNVDERQVCIDLLCAYFRSSQPGEEDQIALRNEIVAATLDVVTGRLRRQTPERRYWGRCTIELADPGEIPSLDGVILYDGGALIIRGATLGDRHDRRYRRSVKNVELNGGTLAFQDVAGKNGSLLISDSRLVGGYLTISLDRDSGLETQLDVAKRFTFRKVTVDGSQLFILTPGCQIEFVDCVFSSGELLLFALEGGSVRFSDCLFKKDVFRSARLPGSDSPTLMTSSLIVDNCQFEDGVPVPVGFTEDDESDA